MLILSSLIGVYMLTGNENIYPSALARIAIKRGGLAVFKRQLYIPFFFILAVIILFSFVFYNFVIRFFIWIFSLCCKKNNVVDTEEISKI